MASMNPFDLLGDDDNGDPMALQNIVVPPSSKEKPPAKKQQGTAQTATGKLPSKPLPPAQAVREARAGQNDGSRGRGGGRGGRGFGNREQEFGYNRGRGGSYNGERSFNRDNYNNAYQGGRGGFYEGSDDIMPGRQEDGEAVQGDWSRGGGRGGGRGGRGGRGYGGRGALGEAGGDETRRRVYERRSGTGRGTEMKREGSGRGNWGTPVDQGVFQEMEEPISAEEKTSTAEKYPEQENNQEVPGGDTELKKEEEEEKEMTLDEYEKVLEEKRKALSAMKLEERKVDVKEFESMQPLSNKKKDEDAVFIKVGSDKDKTKKNEAVEREERIKKLMNINEFLKPAEGERYYGGGRSRGRGRSDRGGFRGGFGGSVNAHQPEAPSIADPGQFPTLGGK